jgi:hypothetical protein
MDKAAFAKFLKKAGRTEKVAAKDVDACQDFARFLFGRGPSGLDQAAPADLDAFVGWVESKPKASARGYLWAIRYYYQFTGNRAMEGYAGKLRAGRVLRAPLPLKEFRGVDPEHLARLAAAGIKNVQQMLSAGCSPEARAGLAVSTGIPEPALLELACLSDLARLPGVKGIRARLYYAAGVKTVPAMAAWDPEALRQILAEFVERNGFEGIPPLPKEVRSTVENARRLPPAVED